MKLSASFFITCAIYGCFEIMAEVAPILHMSKLIVPILILVMVHGTELRMLIMIDFVMVTIVFVKMIPFFEEMVKMYSLTVNSSNDKLIIGLWLYVVVGCFLGRSMNYVLADRVIKSKRLRERIGFATFSA